jgi:hypothetical protein
LAYRSRDNAVASFILVPEPTFPDCRGAARLPNRRDQFSELPKFVLDPSGKSVLLNMPSSTSEVGMKKTLSGSRGSLQGLAEILAQAPQLAAASGGWPGFVLMLTTILSIFAVSLLALAAAGRTALAAFG